MKVKKTAEVNQDPDEDEEDQTVEFTPKRYACKQWPFLRIGTGKDVDPIKFEGGFFTAKTPEQVAMIERNASYGVHIFPIQWKPQPVPVKSGKIAELIEADIVEEIAKHNPRVRRGALGTR